jgi:plasmid replication initiation protein
MAQKDTPQEVTLWQSNFITSAKYEMSSLEKNVLYMVMAQIRKEDTSEKVYVVSARELMLLTGTEIKYADFQKATAKLVTRLLQGTLANGNFLQTTFVASAEYIKGQGLIELTVSPKIRPFYIDLKREFTTFQLNIALNLHTVYAKRLYEIFSMYKNMKDKSFRINLMELKQRLQLIDEKTGRDKYEKFTHFKKAVLDPAEREINSKSDISFSYTIIEGNKAGRGRKPVEQLEFTVVYTEQIAKYSFDENNLPIFSRLTTQFNLRKDQASKVLENFSPIEINKKLYDIHLKIINKEISNIGAYTAKNFDI